MKKPHLYFLFIVIMLSFTSVYSQSLAHTVQPPLVRDFSRFPERIKGWRGTLAIFDPDVMAILGADEVLNRSYLDSEGNILWLYVGYYRKQVSGSQIHSPLHCYPGSGWNPVSHQRVPVQLQDRTIRVNKMIVQHGLERRVVGYWYQSQEKAIASEFIQRLNLLVTAFRKHRTDGALIRISMAIHGDRSEESWKTVVSFIEDIYPQLIAYIPQ